MKLQALFSSKNKSKGNKMSSAEIFVWRFKGNFKLKYHSKQNDRENTLHLQDFDIQQPQSRSKGSQICSNFWLNRPNQKYLFLYNIYNIQGNGFLHFTKTSLSTSSALLSSQRAPFDK